jgi:hypothetical protein
MRNFMARLLACMALLAALSGAAAAGELQRAGAKTSGAKTSCLYPDQLCTSTTQARRGAAAPQPRRAPLGFL